MPQTKKECVSAPVQPMHRPELHFFDNEKELGRRPDYKKYHAHFAPKPQHRVIGEASPIYMYWNTAPYRIWSYNPDQWHADRQIFTHFFFDVVCQVTGQEHFNGQNQAQVGSDLWAACSPVSGHCG